jgi:hypothetical protein
MDQILPLIEKYYEMKDGEFIENHQSFLIVHDDEIDVRLKYKTIKHIVEKRKKDGYKIEELSVLFEKMFKLLESWNYKVVKDERNNSYVLIEKGYQIKALMVALDINLEDDSVCVKTAFFKAATKTDKFIK